MKHFTTLFFLLPLCLFAQDPELESWLLNTDGNTYSGTLTTSVLTDVESVHYNTNYIYVTASGIPFYYQDDESHFDAADQDFVIRFPRNPTEETGTPTNLNSGRIGLSIDGSAILNPGDGQSYNDDDIWNQLAQEFEGRDFDNFNGHSTAMNMYHHHVDNVGVHDGTATTHSPIIGFAADGFPIYGPYGYTDPADATSIIKRMETSYQLRNITDRTTLPDGTVLTASEYGPALSEEALGSYVEDYEYVASSGDLDDHNGRFTVTPEYPAGIYAYFTTIDAVGDPQYPYFIGQTYYGETPAGTFGPSSSSQTIPSNAVLYSPALPVELSSFTLSPIGTDVHLRWTTATELNVSHFEVQRLSTNYVWRGVGEVRATGTSQQARTYTHTDVRPAAGVHYYRLKMVDLDGSVEYSPARSVRVEELALKTASEPLLPYPNPARFRILLNGMTAGELVVKDALGRVRSTQTLDDGHTHTHVAEVEVYRLPAGLYFVEWHGTDGEFLPGRIASEKVFD